MDEAYNQHSKQRRKNRSSTNLNHLSLAPLTSKLPLQDPDALPDSDGLIYPPRHSTSYLEGKSAPTTPSLLSKAGTRSPSRSRLSSGAALPKSKSATHLALPLPRSGKNGKHGRKAVSGASTPKRRKDVFALEEGDGDWLYRAAAMMSTEAREFKGQSWLVSRASSTSLAGGRDSDDEAEEQLERERELESRRASRRGSMMKLDNDISPHGSRHHSRSHSRAGSRAGSRGLLFTPPERHSDVGYFPESREEGEDFDGPDFVNLDERLEALGQEMDEDDEAAIRRLVRDGQHGSNSWMSNILGWTLFSVEENDEDSDSDGNEDTDTSHMASGAITPTVRHFDVLSNPPEERIPAPRADEGGWKDAAWLLSVASKVIL